MSGLSLALAERYAALRFADLPPAAVHAAGISLVDGLAVMLAASRLEPATAPFAAHAVALGGGGACTLLGHAGRATAPYAALANGALAHALDYEDTHDGARLHPNAALIPAVLALAEERQSDGRQLLLALVAGSDFACRLGLALDGDPAARGWYHPPMLSALGAALGAAVLLGLTPPQMVAALSLAGTQFALNDELKRSPETHLRAVRDGLAARAAVEAVLLAERGVTGAEAPLEGESGLFAMLTGGPARQAALLDRLGERFEGEAVGIKLWPCCRGTHAGIAAALQLRGEGVDADDIADIAVTVAPPDDMLLVPAAQKQQPRTAIDAKFSIPFTMASALAGGPPTLATFSPEALGAPRVLALAGKVRLAAVRDGLRGVEVEARLADGAVRRLRAVPPAVPVAARATLAELAEKLEDCLVRAGSMAGAAELYAAVDGLGENGPSALFALLGGRRG